MKSKIRATIAVIFLSRLSYCMDAVFDTSYWTILYYFSIWGIFLFMTLIIKELILYPEIEWSKEEREGMASELQKVAYLFIGLILCEIFYCIIGKDLANDPLMVLLFHLPFILFLVCWTIWSRQ